ncbi:MAG: hypothetical protein ACLGXA_24390 [Acidobacteriota bacterium]
MSLSPLIPNLDPDLKPTLPDVTQGNAPKLPGLGPLPKLVAPPTTDVSGMAGGPSVPALPPVLGPLVANGSPRAMQEQALQNKITGFENPDPAQPGFWHKLGHIAATIGNIAGDVVAPATMALVPGTDLNRALGHAANVHELAGLQRQDQDEQDAASKRALEGAQTAHEGAETAQLENPNDWAVLPATQQGLFIRNAKTGELRPLSFNGQPLTPYEKPLQTEDNQLLGDQAATLQKGLQDRWQVLHAGQTLPANYALNPAMTVGAYKRLDSLLTGEENALNQRENHEDQMANASATRAVAQSNKDEQQGFQLSEAGRKRLDKAEDDYRTAQQGADTMRGMLAQANIGNKMSAQMLPLEGALEITTSQGVKRINRTEVDQYAGAGNLFDRVAGELGKLKSGQPMPKNIRDDIGRLLDAQQGAAYQKYRDAYDSAVKRYKLNDEEALTAPHGFVPRGATHQAKGSDGQWHWTDDTGKKDFGVVQ